MKVLQINCVYPVGSTGKIVNDIHNELLNDGHESIICYGRGKKYEQKNVYKTCPELYSKFNNLISRFTGIMYGGCIISTINLIKIIEKEKPDIVHIHCINGYFVNIYKFINWLKKQKIKTVITLHAEFMYTANCGYAYDCDKWKSGCGNCPRLREETKSLLIDNTHLSWKKMYEAFNNYKNLEIVSVSPWLMKRAKQSPILKKLNHSVILNGVDTNVFKVYDTKKLKKELNLENKKIIFHTTAYFSDNINHRKGGYYILELAKMLEKEDVTIFVAGSYDESIIPPKNVVFLGKINDQKKLAKFYSMADLFVLTSKRETFSMPVAECLCCGTPVVGFEAGAPEQICIKEYSKFVKFGDIDSLYKNVIKFLNNNKAIEISKVAQKKYSKKTMAKEYIKLYEK